MLGRPRRHACNYIGRGVYYGASVSDASECDDEEVYIVGGATRRDRPRCSCRATAKSVTCSCAGRSLEASMSHYLIQQIESERQHQGPHLHRGGRHASARTATSTGLLPGEQADRRERDGRTADRMCSFIGAEPRTDWLDGVVAARRPRVHPVRPGPEGRHAAGRWTGRRTIWKQVCRVCLLQGTCVPNPPSGWRPPSAKGRWR